MNGPAAALLAAYNSHDAGAAAALYGADGEHSEVAQGSSRRGQAAIQASLEGFLGAFPDAHWKLEQSVSEGRLCAIAYRLTGSLAAALGPFEPNGQKLEIRGLFLIELDATGEYIERTSDYWDSGTFTRQMRGG